MPSPIERARDDAREEVRLEPAVGAPPPLPSTFGPGYILPTHRVKLLETKCQHEKDIHVSFEEKNHIYTFHGVPMHTSVSGVAHEFEEPFNGPVVIHRMQQSRNWPSLKYVHNPVRVTDVDAIDPIKALLLVDVRTQKTVGHVAADVSRDDVDGGCILLAACPPTAQVVDCEWYNFDRVMTSEEILAAWAENGELARNLGTEAHLQMELWFNSEPCRLTDLEVINGIRFVDEVLVPLRAKAHRTEWEIVAPDEDMAGCIDLSVRLPDGRLILVDWKRSANLHGKMTCPRRMRAPLKALDACNGCAYALQLSLYQYILEKYYNVTVADRILVSLYPDDYFVGRTPYLAPETEYLMRLQRERFYARQCVAKQHPRLACDLTSKLAYPPVRLDDGRLVWKKAALLHGLAGEEDSAAHAEMDDLIAGALRPISPPAQCEPWSRRYAAHAHAGGVADALRCAAGGEGC